jgi:hypothetical protein
MTSRSMLVVGEKGQNASINKPYTITQRNNYYNNATQKYGVLIFSSHYV